MTNGGPRNGGQVKPEDNCNWCNKPVGNDGAKTSTPGFPYCSPDQSRTTRKKNK